MELMGIYSNKRSFFLAALSSSSLVVCRSVGPLMFVKKWPLEYQKLEYQVSEWVSEWAKIFEWNFSSEIFQVKFIEWTILSEIFWVTFFEWNFLCDIFWVKLFEWNFFNEIFTMKFLIKMFQVKCFKWKFLSKIF